MAGLAIACPGQGGQHPGMFEICLQSAAGEAWLAEYSDSVDIDVLALARKGMDLFSNRHAQLLICACAGATWAALRDRLAAPELFVGYSVGELAAYGCAGVWGAGELARIATVRAACMDAAAPLQSGMMAVKTLVEAQVIHLCQRYQVEIAIANGDDHFVLGGRRADLEQAASWLEEHGHWFRLLDVTLPSHTSAMRAASPAFQSALSAFPAHACSAPVLAGIDGCATSALSVASTLAAQISQRVRWHDCMRATLERGVDVVLELGPGASLSRMFAELDGRLQTRSVDDFRTLEGIVKWIEARRP